jgi:hypothetical protein
MDYRSLATPADGRCHFGNAAFQARRQFHAKRATRISHEPKVGSPIAEDCAGQQEVSSELSLVALIESCSSSTWLDLDWNN